jgi:hypothetical protein
MRVEAGCGIISDRGSIRKESPQGAIPDGKDGSNGESYGIEESYANTVPKPIRKMGDGLETHGLPTETFYGSPRMEALLS